MASVELPKAPSRAERERLALVAGLCILFGLYGWAVFASTFRHPGSIGLDFNAPGTDFMVFYAAARDALHGDFSRLFDGVRFTAHLNRLFAPLLSRPLEFRPFLYPPPLLVLLLPLGLVPFGLAYALFLASSFAALAGAVALWVEDRRGRLVACAALLLCPAASADAVLGQNAFLTAALLLGGLALLERRPALAGVLLGLLTVKPQLFLMVPFALLGGRRYRSLASLALTALALIAASLLLFGAAPWRGWAGLALHPTAEFAEDFFRHNRMWGDSVFAYAVVLGAARPVADLLQAAATAAAAAASFLAFRRGGGDPMIRAAILLALTALGAPHIAGYDLIVLVAAAGALLLREREAGVPSPTALYLLLGIWLASLLPPPAISRLGFLLPAIGLALALVLFRRARTLS